MENYFRIDAIIMHRFSSLCNRIWPNIQAKSIRPELYRIFPNAIYCFVGGFDLSHCCAPLDIHFPHHNDIRFRCNRFEWGPNERARSETPWQHSKQSLLPKYHCHYIIGALVFAQLDNFNGKTVVYLNILWFSTTEHDLIFHFFYGPREKSCPEPAKTLIE